MTYCVAWKAFGCVFIFADSILTGPAESVEAAHVKHTSFRELEGPNRFSGATLFCEEGGFKIREFNGVAVTYAGSLRVALAMLDVIQQCFDYGQSARKSLESALASVQPVNPVEDTTVLLGCNEKNKARLFRLDTSGTGSIDEIEELCQIGSIAECHRQNVGNMIREIRNEIEGRYRPEHHTQKSILSRILALLQSLGVHDVLTSDGVGGGFSGVCVSAGGVLWQPDMLYVVHSAVPQEDSSFCVGVFVRQQVACLVSTAIKVNKFIASPLLDESVEARFQRADQVSDEVLAQFDAGRFDYVAFLNNTLHTVTVFEMNGNLYHQMFAIDAKSPVEGKIGILWTDGLLRLVNTIPRDADGGQPDMGLMWIPYYQPNPLLIAEMNTYLEEMHAQEGST